MKTMRLLAACLGAIALAFGLVATDRLLSRPGRRQLLAALEQLQHVREAMLRFQLDRQRQPETLQELTAGYLSAASLAAVDTRGGTAPLQFTAATGMLRWPVAIYVGGLWPRRLQPELMVERRAVHVDRLTGEPVLGAATTTIAPPEDAVVVEAEHFQFLTYGWEIERSEQAGGGACIHLKEGAGDLRRDGVYFHPEQRSGDFYNVTGDNREIEARCRFTVPAPGSYQLWVRTMAHRTHCSNIIRVRVNDNAPLTVGDNGTEPFVWLWQHCGSAELPAGPGTISFLTYQDDIKVDQVLLTRSALPAIAGATAFRAPANVAAVSSEAPTVTFSISVPTLVLDDTAPPKASVFLHCDRPAGQSRTLHVSLDQPGGRRRERDYAVPLAENQALTEVPLVLELDVPRDRREYLLRCVLQDPAGQEPDQARTLVFCREFAWQVLGPLPFLRVDQEGPLDAQAPPATSCTVAGKSFTWQPYDPACTDHFAIMDFGRMFSGRVYDALENVTLYAYTEFEADEAGKYLLKVQGDDHLIVWLNGKKVVTVAEEGATAIRSARDVPVTLAPGRQQLLLRLNQTSGQWQASCRVRRADGQVPATLRGVPAAAQKLQPSPVAAPAPVPDSGRP